MRLLRLSAVFFVAVTGGALLGLGCGTSAPAACSPANCAGCCATSGECVTGNTTAQCGTSGNQCAACSAGQACEFGICRTVAVGGGGGTNDAGSGGGGGATGGGGGTGGGGSTGGGGGSTGGGGGATGGGGGSTGGGGGAFDAGPPPVLDAGTTGLDGGAVNPPTVSISFMPSCGAVTPCPGNERGTWVYTAGCIEDAAFTRLASAAGQIGCTATISNKRGYIAGAVVFDGTQLRRNVVGVANFHFSGAGAVCVQACSFISGQLPAGISGTCTPSLASCECELSFDLSDTSTANYTYTAGVLTTPTERFDTCITGNELDYRETTDAGALPGIFTLTRQ
ncbi:MAG: hypothetical protein ACOZQL_05340 [Myxococcota bacterium]